MWEKPWGLLEGLIIALGLIIAGIMLEITAGPVMWDAFAWPANIIALVTLIGIIVIMHMMRKRFYACAFLGTYTAAIPTLAVAVVLTIIMGLTRQTVGGTWIYDMLTFWPFVLIYVLMTIILGLAILKHITHFNYKRDIPFLLNHLGLFIALTCGTMGNADMQRLKMITEIGQVEWRALDQQQAIKELPIAIELKQFIMEQYNDGSPKRFASEVQILSQTGKNIHAIIDVNKPVEIDGWKIYQYGYDTNAGPRSRISIFELVRDTWLPAVYAGIIMMLAGAAGMFILSQRRTS